MVTIIVLLLLGVCLGSFVNALVYRLHAQQSTSSKTAQKKLSITTGRSLCPHCKHALATKDLVPVLSWVSLRGKCRYCHKPIGWQYPLVELLVPVLFLVSYLAWPIAYSFDGVGKAQFGLWLASLVLFTAMIIYDLRWMILPNKLVYPAIGLAVLHLALLTIGHKDPGVLMMAFWAVVCSAGFFYLLFQVSNGKWIGGGDVKVAIALGILVGGPLQSALMLFVASLAGSITSLPLLITKKVTKSAKVPFGPFLLLATIIVYLFGASITQWYERIFLGF